MCAGSRVSTRVFLVRHGATERSAENRFASTDDDFRDATQPRLTLFNDTSHYDRDLVPEMPHGRLSKVWDTSR